MITSFINKEKQYKFSKSIGKGKKIVYKNKILSNNDLLCNSDINAPIMLNNGLKITKKRTQKLKTYVNDILNIKSNKQKTQNNIVTLSKKDNVKVSNTLKQDKFKFKENKLLKNINSINTNRITNPKFNNLFDFYRLPKSKQLYLATKPQNKSLVSSYKDLLSTNENKSIYKRDNIYNTNNCSNRSLLESTLNRSFSKLRCKKDSNVKYSVISDNNNLNIKNNNNLFNNKKLKK